MVSAAYQFNGVQTWEEDYHLQSLSRSSFAWTSYEKCSFLPNHTDRTKRESRGVDGRYSGGWFLLQSPVWGVYYSSMTHASQFSCPSSKPNSLCCILNIIRRPTVATHGSFGRFHMSHSFLLMRNLAVQLQWIFLLSPLQIYTTKADATRIAVYPSSRSMPKLLVHQDGSEQRNRTSEWWLSNLMLVYRCTIQQ